MTPERREYMRRYYRESEREKQRQATRRATPEHKAYMRAYKARYRQLNRERIAEKDKAYRTRTRAQARETQRRWRERNRERVNEAAARRRQMPPWADRAKILSIYALAAELSRLTGVPHEVDHVIPLHGRRVSGLHVEDNLAVLPRSANRRKSRSFEAA